MIDRADFPIALDAVADDALFSVHEDLHHALVCDGNQTSLRWRENIPLVRA